MKLIKKKKVKEQVDRSDRLSEEQRPLETD